MNNKTLPIHNYYMVYTQFTKVIRHSSQKNTHFVCRKIFKAFTEPNKINA